MKTTYNSQPNYLSDAHTKPEILMGCILAARDIVDIRPLQVLHQTSFERNSPQERH